MAGDQPDLVAEPRAEAAGVGPGDRRAIDAVARQEIAGAGPHTKEGLHAELHRCPASGQAIRGNIARDALPSKRNRLFTLL